MREFEPTWLYTQDFFKQNMIEVHLGTSHKVLDYILWLSTEQYWAVVLKYRNKTLTTHRWAKQI